jgi:hypothetical protein
MRNDWIDGKKWGETWYFEAIQLPLANPGAKQGAMATDMLIRSEALQAQNIDKGLDMFIGHFKPGLPVAAMPYVGDVLHKEFGWAVYMQQGNRICFHSGRVFDYAKEEATLAALASTATLEPSPTKREDYQGLLFFPEEFALDLEEVLEHLNSVRKIPGFPAFSEWWKKLIHDFTAGTNKFTFLPVSEALPKHESVAQEAATSRFRQN